MLTGLEDAARSRTHAAIGVATSAASKDNASTHSRRSGTDYLDEVWKLLASLPARYDREGTGFKSATRLWDEG